MTANDIKSNLGYLKQLVDEYNNIYHCFVGKNTIDTDFSALFEKIEKNPKAPKFKVSDRLRITKNKIF